jgi:dihydrofolate synthase/folylpolyglutamate synthase
VDLAVFEVGMGGRYDATNILHAAVSVITPIGFDHERFLGSTIQEIASEKAAIIKTGRPVVVGALEPEALAVVENEASHRGARVIRALDGVRVHAKEVEGGQLVELQTPACDYGSFTLPILGRHQLDNLVVAVRVAELAHEELGLPRRIDPDTVRAGVEAARWPGRLERRGGRPVFLLDAAHNIMAAERLADYLESHPHANRVLLFGVMKDKRVHEMLGQLLPHVSAFVATRPEMSRAREPAELAAWARDRGFAAESVPDSRAALDRARTLAGETGEVVVAGSIFLLGEIVEAMEERRERHKNKTSP